MEIGIAGGGWITADGFGCLSEAKAVRLSSGAPVLPEPVAILKRSASRYGRFDDFTRLGFSAVGMALKEAGWLENPPADPIGLVVSTACEVLATDIAFYKTTLEQGGTLSSPNLFSYTLPVAVLGECAVNFRLTGPTYVIGDDGHPGRTALEHAVACLSSGDSRYMIAAWIDSPPSADVLAASLPAGSLAVALDGDPPPALVRRLTLTNNGSFQIRPTKEGANPSLLDLMNFFFAV